MPATDTSAATTTTFTIGRWLYLRVLAITFLFAFVSLADQIVALVGPGGMDPAAVNLARAREVYGGWAWLRVPSVFWLSVDPGVLTGSMWVGVGAAALAILNIAPRISLAVCWILFLSVCGLQTPELPGMFFDYPPDHVLTEGGLLALLIAPRGLRPGLGAPVGVPRWPRWLTYVLLFKLMFGSGIAKLVNGQELWWDLTALAYDFETRPAPTPLAVYGHELPIWMLRAGALFTFAAEVVAPWFYFWPGRPRRVAGVVTLALLVAIMATGNYRWFPLATFAFATLLIDDTAWRRVLGKPRESAPRLPEGAPPPKTLRTRIAAAATVGFAALLIGLGACQTIDSACPHHSPLRIAKDLRMALRPYHLSHGFNLFGVVEERLLVQVFEGSEDGANWKEFRGHVNPSELDRPPGFVAPYHHYLDFLSWASADLPWQSNPRWVQHLLHGLLRGESTLFALFRHAPFSAARPPRFVRISVFHYEFSQPDQRAKGQWWNRKRVGTWSPTLTLVDGVLQVVAAATGTVR